MRAQFTSYAAMSMLRKCPLSRKDGVGEKTLRDRYDMIEREDPRALPSLQLAGSDAPKRRAHAITAEALDRDSIIRYKLYGIGTPAGSLLSPLLAESASFPIPYDPAHAEHLLDEAGFPEIGRHPFHT